ncbi:P60-like protein [Gossypium australe]|uniref:Ribosome biogenesis protein NOP53 n=1 Tax=Gossypium australe TaxID=47621 RepID=A0A5B6WJE5_9ROSI|nr:P60-like protein [Gossypium australe]
MGKKSKTSRKGKKAWRANISTEDIHDFFEKSTKDALSGGSLTSAPTESLFFIDKSQDLSVKKKIEKKREKVLRVDSMLKKNPFVEAVPSSKQKKSKKKKKEALNAKDVVQDVPKDETTPDSGMVPIWGDGGQHSGKARQVSKQSIIPAVEVEPPGCSYNPTFDSHQDSLAQAVAEEMQKAYKIELGPQPVPLTVMGEVVDEDDKYFIEADDGNDDEMDEENLSEDDNATEKRPLKTKRVTRVELNKRARRKEQQKKEAEAKRAEEFSKDIDNLPDILQEIAKEDEEKQKRHLRKAIAKQERLKACPPRLGKYKFQAAPPQVLLSEELTGSLRKLKGCATLARDRFKSLEKRGLIPPSAKSGRSVES